VYTAFTRIGLLATFDSPMDGPTTEKHNVLSLKCGQREPQVPLEMQNEDFCG